MNTSLKKSSEKSGLAPGSLVHVGDILEPTTSISVVNYTKETVEEETIKTVDEILKYKDSDSVTLVLLEGLTNINATEQLGSIFGIHHLVLEDILNTDQRPKFEEHADYLYITVRCLTSKEEQFSVLDEQISIILANKFVLVFKEKKDDLLHPVLKRIRINKSRFRKLGPDYLAYAILDLIVDQNFILIDSLEDAITTVENDLLNSEPTQETLGRIQKLKRETIRIKRHVTPVEELTNQILHSESDFFHEETILYMKDVHDHAIRVSELIESYRELLSGLLQIYMSLVSNKMNEVMKVLTVFASIFIPLTFLAGIYGMNFDYMPELKWKWAYPVLWILFITIPLVLLACFKKKKWL